jgi:phosphate transport system ATP-binding protein
MSDTAVKASSFSFWYGEKQALHNIDLSIPDKSITALIGPSGCGKSTFLRSINRMNETIPGIRHEGEIVLKGDDIYGSGIDVEDLRTRVGMVFQRSNPFPKSIYNNVAYGPRINRPMPRRKMDELVEKSLRRAALWDEVLSGFPEDSNSGFASPGHWRTTLRFFSWTSRRARSTQ